MTKTFCDRCKKEIPNDLIVYHFQIFEGYTNRNTEADICDYCYKAFESFMKMEDSMYHTNPSNHHGIERMTIGSR